MTRADDTLVSASGTSPAGFPIYSRPAGAGFSLVIEGGVGASGVAVGRSAFQVDLTSFPDLQVQVSRSLGDGSPTVCDRSGSMIGGVPSITPVSFDPTQTNINTINDLSCRFLDGTGVPVGRTTDACVLFPSGSFQFVSRDTTTQFCGFIDRPVEFPDGDTQVTARLRDTAGNVGPTASIVIHVGP